MPKLGAKIALRPLITGLWTPKFRGCLAALIRPENLMAVGPPLTEAQMVKAWSESWRRRFPGAEKHP